ncbi:hypothetical protein [Microbacterium sp. CR_7]|uniref:hypothetical protein n=1 Tax=Microbacterium sp. CR_7 TaxID=3055792 RepID=UPI0035BFA7A5
MVEPLASECARLGLATPYSEADIRFAVIPFLRWALGPAGFDPDLELIFTTRNIERFITVAMGQYSKGSLGNLRGRLFRISERIADPRDRRRPVKALPSADPAMPYTTAEVAALRSWAWTQTGERAVSAMNLLALGLGAGLSTSEITNLRIEDVVQSEHTEIAIRGVRPRTVTMLDLWASDLTLAEEEPHRFVFRPGRQSTSKNVVSHFVSRAPGLLRPQPQRLRATWIVRHLESDTNVVTLMTAAGVDSLEAFTRYVGFVTAPDERASRRQLARPARLLAEESVGGK